MRNARISLAQYYDLVQESDISPNYHPGFAEFYFGQLRMKPKIIGRYNKEGRLVCAFPVLYGLVFPNSLHKRILGKRGLRLGDIGQPEALFPVDGSVGNLGLGRISPITSPLLRGTVRAFGRYSLKSMAIAKATRHKTAKESRNKFVAQGGEIHFSEEFRAPEFADIYIGFYAQRRGCSVDSLRYVREQIIALYRFVNGVVLLEASRPVAALLAFKCASKSIYYIQGINYAQGINMGIKQTESRRSSYGNIMLLESLRRAEESAASLGKRLRYSFGYCYGEKDYKKLWAEPEETFIGY